MAWIVLGMIVVAALAVVFVYNSLVALRQRTRQAFADIDVQLKQRRDLVPNLVEAVKGYAAHERGTLEAVIEARNRAQSAAGMAERAAAEGALTGALGRLIALAENYPELKASQNFLQLQTELGGLEDRIAAARRFFNNAAAEYNAARESFPAALFAASFGFQPQEFFDLGAEERARALEPPAVKF